jgi:hypothetical protein
VDVLSFFSQKRKYQRKKSQPGPVANRVQWLGKGSNYRNITNAARGEVMFGL